MSIGKLMATLLLAGIPLLAGTLLPMEILLPLI